MTLVDPQAHHTMPNQDILNEILNLLFCGAFGPLTHAFTLPNPYKRFKRHKIWFIIRLCRLLHALHAPHRGAAGTLLEAGVLYMNNFYSLELHKNDFYTKKKKVIKCACWTPLKLIKNFFKASLILYLLNSIFISFEI